MEDNKNIWGPIKWNEIHNKSISYNPKEDSEKKEMIEYINNLPASLNCKRCQTHTQIFIDRYDLTQICKSRRALFEFFVKMHNSINKRLSKPIMSPEEARALYL